MLYMFHCTDKADHSAVRIANRADHLAYLERLGDRIVLAGPLLGDDGTSMVGSLLVIDFPDQAAADEFRDGDPYAKAGLFQSVVVRPMRKVLPRG